MRCATHNYEYDFLIGKCPYCEADERATAARESADASARASREQSERHHEELQAAMEEQRYAMEQMEEQRLARLEEMEEQRLSRMEELEETRRRNHEETFERARLAKIAHDVETLCRAAERKLADNRPTFALEDAERAVDIDPTNWSALNLAYSAAKQASNRAGASKYLERLVKLHVAGSRGRLQTDSTESDRLLVEAASGGAGSESLVMTLVDAYRGPPGNLRDVLNKIGRKELLGAWLDTRLRRFSSESPAFPIKYFLDAIAALPDGAARISKLSGEFFEHVGFDPSTAVWLTNNGYSKEAAAYNHSCAIGLDPNGVFQMSFVEWSIMNDFHGDADAYVRRMAPKCDAATRVSTLIPLALETSHRLKVSGAEWVAMLQTDLATLPASSVDSRALTLPVLSATTRQEVTAALIEHVTKVIRGPQAYRTAAGVAQAAAGTATVYSVKRGKEISRPLLTLPVLVVGLVAGLAAWLLPGGDFSGGVVWGIFVCIVAFIWTFIYRHQKSESLNAQIGKYVANYCQRLEAIGIDKKATSTLISQVPDVNPHAHYAFALGTIGVLTALVCASNFFSATSNTKPPMASGTQSRSSNVASPSTGSRERAQMEARRQAEEAAARKQADLAADAQQKALWEAEARSRLASAQAEARRVNVQMLADAKNINQQARARLQLDYQQAMAEANRNQQSARSAAQNEVMQQISRKVAGLQGAAQVLSQQDAANAQAQFKQAQAVAHARRQQAESEAQASYQIAQAEAKEVLEKSLAEAQRQYQIERVTGPTAPKPQRVAAQARPAIRQAEAADARAMAEDPQSGCKVWKPNLLPSESVTWSGACTEGYASGNGIARWSSGGKELLTYEGVFKGGLLQGHGVMLASGGDRYEGDYKDGMRDGQGIYTSSAGQRYEGGFRDNKKHGFATVTDANGVRSEVSFQDGQQLN